MSQCVPSRVGVVLYELYGLLVPQYHMTDSVQSDMMWYLGSVDR